MRNGRAFLNVFAISPLSELAQQAPSGPSCPTSTMIESRQMAYRKEFVEALRLLAPAFERLVAAGQPRPVLVGGAAVEFYTGSAVVSGDCDGVTEAQDAFEAILLDLGFVREKRHGRLLRGLYHQDLEMGVEVVSGRLFDGACDETRIRLVDIRDGQRIAMAPVADLIADPLGQYCAPKARGPAARDQAIKLYQLAEDVDESYLDLPIQDETQNEYDIEYLKAASG